MASAGRALRALHALHARTVAGPCLAARAAPPALLLHTRLASGAAQQQQQQQPPNKQVGPTSIKGIMGFLSRILINNLNTGERQLLAGILHPQPPPPPPVEIVREVEVVREVRVEVPVKVPVQVVKEVVKEVQVVKEVPAAVAPEHPVLGNLVYDFGFKRVYAMRPENLCDARVVPVWNLQRSFRLERAETIAKAKLKDPVMGFPGVITLYQLPSAPGQPDGFRAILDGQHRVGALRLLGQRGKFGETFKRVLVEVFPLSNEAAAESLFVEINQAQPVLLVDMPSSGGGASLDAKETLERAVQAVAAKYPAMFSPSLNCKPPHLNVDSLRDKLFQTDALNTYGIKSDEELVKWLMSHNERLSKRPDEEWLAARPAAARKSGDTQFKKALQKARTNGLFLGMDAWRWLEAPSA